MLFVTHNLPLVRSVAHRVAVMADGRIVEVGATEQVLAAPEQEYTKRLLADTPQIERRTPARWWCRDADAGLRGLPDRAAGHGQRPTRRVGSTSAGPTARQAASTTSGCATTARARLRAPVTKEQTFELVSLARDEPRARRRGRRGRAGRRWSADGHRSRVPPRLAARPPLRRAAARRTRGRAGRVGRSTPGCRRRSTARTCSPTTTRCSSGSSRCRAYGVTRLRGRAARAGCGRARRRTGRHRPGDELRGAVGRAVASPTRSPTPTRRSPSRPTSTSPPASTSRACSSCTASRTRRPVARASYLDGFRVAEILRDEHPDGYRVLTTGAVALGQPLEGQRLPLVVAADRPRSVGRGRGARRQLAAGAARRRVRRGRGGVRRLPARCSSSRTAPTSPSASRCARRPAGVRQPADPARPGPYAGATAARCCAGATSIATSCSSRIRILERERRMAWLSSTSS